MPPCPTADSLRAFLADELSPEERSRVGPHIDGCLECQQALESLLDPTMTRAPASPEDAALREPALTSLMERLRQTLPLRGRSQEEEVRFPGPPTAEATLGQLGPYQVLRLLGRGATSLVYEARDSRLDRTVALKILRPERAVLPGVRERFEREARVLASLRHEHLVAVYDVGTPDDFPWYLVMEHVDGEPLSAWLAREPRPRQAVEVVRQAAMGLAAAHEQGLVHRDVKPANILVDAAGRARVADFGLVLDAEWDETLTADGQVLGTPAYMSPEQARGLGHAVDARSDVWGLGVVLYELLTGRLPFPARGREVLAQVVHEEPPRPRKLRPALSRDLETIVLECLAKEPAWRYTSARELADDLGRWLDGEAIHARPPGPLRRLRRWAGRHRGLVAGLLLVLVIGTAAAAYGWKQHRTVDEVHARNGILMLETKAAHLLDDGDDVEAESVLLRALAESEELAKRFPHLREEVVRILRRLGELNDDQEFDDEAETYYRRALAAAQQWTEGLPSPEARRTVAAVLRRLAELLQERKPPGDWQTLLERYVALETRLVSDGEAEADAIHDLYPACLRLANRYREHGKPDEGERLDREAEELLDRANREAKTAEDRADVFLLRARGRAERGETEEVFAAAVQIRKLNDDDPLMAYRVAVCYALCLQALSHRKAAGPESERREEYERLALQELGRAVRLGFDEPSLLHDDAWEPLRRHPEFRKLRRQMR